MTDFLSNMLGQMIGEVLGESLETILDRRALERALSAAVSQAERRFAQEFRPHDPEIVDALTTQTRFADLPSVRAALRDLLTRPFHDTAAPIAELRRSFDDVLPGRVERARVDAAMGAFLVYLGREVLYIPQLRDVYGLAFQKIAADSSRQIATSADAMARQFELLRTELLESRQALPAPGTHAALPPPARPRPWHNLPQRSYTRFVGRQAELDQLHRLLLPHPRSRHFVLTLDGIGGVGKSALALELAYGYRDGYTSRPADERFEAIVWASAKRTLLTAGGMQQRQQTFNTANDLFREIATVLDQQAILQAEETQRRGMLERVLMDQRTLLIVDNLETIDDEELLAFLREVPDPTKVLITTRHRIDIAYTIRLAGMPEADAKALMMVEAARKGVELSLDTQSDQPGAPQTSVPSVAILGELYRKTGGIPLAIVWSIGLMSLGHSVGSVLRRLGSGHSDIARFCFAESVAHIRDRDAYQLLLALALFESHVSRVMLGAVAGLGDDLIGRDDGLAELLQLSLTEQKGDRFFLLPLTQSYALEELAARPEIERELRTRWIETLVEMARPYRVFHQFQPKPAQLLREGGHLVALARWAQQAHRPEVYLDVLPALLAFADTSGNWADVIEFGHSGMEYAALLGREDALPQIDCALAWVLSQRGQHAEAERALDAALEIEQRLGDLRWQVEILGRQAQVVRRSGDIARAEAICRRALDLIADLPPGDMPYARAELEYELGKVARDRGEWLIARQHFRDAQRVYSLDEEQPAFNPERAWGIAGNIAYINHQMGDLDKAAERYRRSLAFFRHSGGRGYLATLLIRLATLENQRGNRAVALEYAREALEWSRKLGLAQERAQAEALLESLGTEVE